MKKYVWSETVVHGGQPFSGTLPHPPSNTGAFQNESVHDQQPPPGSMKIPEFYKDTVVIAYKRPAEDKSIEDLHAKITASGGSPDFALLTDGDLQNTTKLPIAPEGQASWIQYEFAEPQTIRAVTYVARDPDRFASMVAHMGVPAKVLESSDDGQNFHKVANLSGDHSSPEYTSSFAPITAKYFRFTIRRTPHRRPPPGQWGSILRPLESSFRPRPPTMRWPKSFFIPARA